MGECAQCQRLGEETTRLAGQVLAADEKIAALEAECDQLLTATTLLLGDNSDAWKYSRAEIENHARSIVHFAKRTLGYEG